MFTTHFSYLLLRLSVSFINFWFFFCASRKLQNIFSWISLKVLFRVIFFLLTRRRFFGKFGIFKNLVIYYNFQNFVLQRKCAHQSTTNRQIPKSLVVNKWTVEKMLTRAFFFQQCLFKYTCTYENMRGRLKGEAGRAASQHQPKIDHLR